VSEQTLSETLDGLRRDAEAQSQAEHEQELPLTAWYLGTLRDAARELETRAELAERRLAALELWWAECGGDDSPAKLMETADAIIRAQGEGAK
jgi:hypothetical protein